MRNRRHRKRHSTAMGKAMAPLFRELQGLANRMAKKSWAAGLRQDGSWVRREDEGTPNQAACCPDHANTKTRWRGPLPSLGDAPMVQVAQGHLTYDVMATPDEGESRKDAADRLYALADQYGDKPCPLGQGYLIWQMSPCSGCMSGLREEWLEEVWPSPATRARRVLAPQAGDGDWDL